MQLYSQQRAVDKAVEVKYGSRLSPASPIWQEVAKVGTCLDIRCDVLFTITNPFFAFDQQKLKKKGNDVHLGDEVKLNVCAEELQLCDTKTQGKYFSLYSRDIVMSKVCPSACLFPSRLIAR